MEFPFFTGAAVAMAHRPAATLSVLLAVRNSTFSRNAATSNTEYFHDKERSISSLIGGIASEGLAANNESTLMGDLATDLRVQLISELSVFVNNTAAQQSMYLNDVQQPTDVVLAGGVFFAPALQLAGTRIE